MRQNKLDEFMKKNKITNVELARLTGLHRKTIQEAREGLIKPRYSTLRKINKAIEEKEREVLK